jgi:hypothetical protein
MGKYRKLPTRRTAFVAISYRHRRVSLVGSSYYIGADCRVNRTA